MPWQIQLVLWACFVTAFVLVPLAGWWDVSGRDWWELRQLVQLARSYGIEYVPGENVKQLRARIIERRDALLEKP